MTITTFHEACAAIIRNRTARALNYAVGYAQAGLYMRDGTDEQRVQALYILNNMTHWRGDEAKQVRAVMKRVGEVK